MVPLSLPAFQTEHSFLSISAPGLSILCAVVDADFSQAETLPALLNALEVDYEVDGKRKTLVLEVQQHIGDGWVRAVAMSSTDGLRRGMPVRDTGRPIEVPVGQCVLGRVSTGRG